MPKLILLLVMLTLVQTDVAAAFTRESILDRLLIGKEFDFVNWEVNAAFAKIGNELTSPQTGVSDTDRVTLVRAYMRQVGELEHLENQINAVYTDPQIKDAAAATVALRAQRDQLRAEINTRQNVAEAIMQEQVESILREEGFAIGGQVMPPLRFRFTPLPYVLIISKRDKIELIDQRELNVGLTVDEFDAIEKAVEKRLNVSSLVTPIGGLGAYPTMLPETASLQFTLETAAHEWTHNFLFFSPVGAKYSDDPMARVINETTAVIVQQEIGRRVLQRYYPELAPPPPAPAPPAATPAPTPQPQPNQPPSFSFNAAMRETRLRVDVLLAEGK
ncbi:MAG TPA: hypothetical protein VGK87_06355, partial [Anaerolineae bacterium]